MIRINLLPSGKKKSFSLPPAMIYGIITIVIAIAAIIGLTYYLNKQISAKKTEIHAKEQKLKTLQAALQEVKNYERDNAEYRQKTMVIEQLKKNQTVPLRLLDEVSEMLPKGVWLSSLQDSSGLVSIEGFAFTNSDLVAYVQNLKRSKHLKNAMLVESRQSEIEEFSIYKFRLTFQIKV
jgi:Tfp pilus assembly protein PilN